MDYTRRIRRTGALAAAVALGAAVAATPATSNASPGTSPSSTSESNADSTSASRGPSSAGSKHVTAKPDRQIAAMDVEATNAPSVPRDSLPPRKRLNRTPTSSALTSRGGDAHNRSVRQADVITRQTSHTVVEAGTDSYEAYQPRTATAEPTKAVGVPEPTNAVEVAEPTNAVGAAFGMLSRLAAAALDTWAPRDDTTSPAAWAMLAVARREIGDDASAVIPGAARVVATQTAAVPVLGSWLDDIKTFIDNAVAYIQTYVDPPLLHLIPDALNSIFNNPPDATPLQVEVDLQQGVTSGPIPFSTNGSTDRSVVYTVPEKGAPGGAQHGTVAVDNATGTFTYTPDETFTGTDTFSFVVKDTTHLPLLDGLFGAVLDFLGLSDGFRNTATATIFNGVPIQPDPDIAAYTDITGDFSMLTYNIAGLPSYESGAAWPRIPNILDIGSRINSFDVVDVQDDVAYHQFLAAPTSFSDQTTPAVPAWLGALGDAFSDGLNTFAIYKIEQVNRLDWSGCTVLCTGSGFVYSRLNIPGGESIDLYNIDTRQELTNADIEQLSTFIQQNSIGRAVVVTGDFNQLYSDPGQTLSQFATANGLTDAWVQLEYGGTVPLDAPTCSYESSCEQTDKIFYRSAAPLNLDDPATSPVQLFAQTYSNEGLNFLNGNGQDLSNHTPQAVTFGYSVGAVGPSNVDPENWMAELPGISSLPLTQLPIPGTHDSGSYGITGSSEWALTGISDFGKLTELPPLIEKLIVKPIVAGWAKTQGMDLYDQFANGIRYVDLRFSNETGPDADQPNGIYIEHGLRGPLADEVIAQIADFAYSHPKEVLVINVWGLNNFDAESNAELVSQMEDAFGSRMVPSSLGTSASLEDLWAIDKNVIVTYDDPATVAMNPNLWSITDPPSQDYGLPTLYRPWPNVPSAPQLYTGNVHNLEQRPATAIWDLFGEPTENTNNIIMGLLLLGPMTQQAFMARWHPYLQPWLQVDFKTAVNLVTEDWFEQVGPTPASYARDVMAAVYETLGLRLASTESG